MKYMTPAKDPEALLQGIARPDQPPIRRMHRPGFNHLIGEMPVIDATKGDQAEEIETTRQVLDYIGDELEKVMDSMEIPEIPDHGFGRIILAIEEPKKEGDIIVPGTEVVLALWGKGFQSPVHGHAPGFINETLISGAFDVHLYEGVGKLSDRVARYSRTIQQRTKGIFYDEYVRDEGQEERSSVIHNFMAIEPSRSLHYLPEHVRDGNANRFQVVNTPESGQLPQTRSLNPEFHVTNDHLRQVQKEEILKGVDVGMVYLVRSQGVPYLGDHYVMITGDFVEKPQGRRQSDISFLVPHGTSTPLDKYDKYEDLVILELDDIARNQFYKMNNIEDKFRKKGLM